MGNEIVPREEQFDRMKKFMMSKKSMSAIAMALPAHINAEKMARVAITSVVRTPKLLECEPATLMDAVLQASTLGLLPDGVLGHGYILPYKDKKTGKLVATFIPGYKGLLDLARRSGEVAWIQARIVYAGDEFDYEYGMGNTLRHVPARAHGKEPGDFKAVYCIAKFKSSGEFQFEVMYKDQIKKIQNSSRGGNTGAWVSDWESMALKTVIRRLCKFLPLNPEHHAYVTRDEYAEAGVLGEYLETTAEVLPPEDPMDPLDALAEDLGKSTSPQSSSPSSPSSEPTPVEESGSHQEGSSKTGSTTSEASQTGPPIDDAPPIGEDPVGDTSPHEPDLSFGDDQTKGRITKDEDAKFAVAIANLKERMLKVQGEDLVNTFIARTCGVYGGERPTEIRSRMDREKFWRDLSQMCEQWESMAGQMDRMES